MRSSGQGLVDGLRTFSVSSVESQTDITTEYYQNMRSPYAGLDESEWKSKTESLIKKHPLDQSDIKKIVLNSWDCILGSFASASDGWRD